MKQIDQITESSEILPHLIRLLDDETPAVRQTVINKLLSFGIHLKEELANQKILLTEPQQQILDQCVYSLLESKTLNDKLDRFPLFKPGMLIKHKHYGYRGVIVDFDRMCQADNDWYKKNQTQPEKSQPWYHVLVHNSGSVTYAAQSSLEKDQSIEQVLHPLIPFFFNGFNKGFYLRNERQWGK
ncbi:MAG: heat shock protein HspQ [Lentisphaerales bacterium]|nr:heat shock protein HspQ [Lentisphaerales bacterium]